MGEREGKSKDQLLVKLRKVMKKGDKKSSTFAAEEALKFYKRSLEHLEKQELTPEVVIEKVEMQLLLAEILYILGRWDPAISYLNRIQKMGPKKAGLAQVAEAHRKSGNLWALKGDIDHTFDDYEKALTLSKELGDPLAIADSERGLGYAHWRRGNISEAERHYERAFKSLEGSKDEDLLAKTYLESGNVFNDKGDLDRAVDYYMKAIRVFRRSKDIYQEARGYNNLGDVCIKRKAWNKGIRYFEKCAALADSINDLHMQGWALFNAAECHAKGGNLGEAEECCTKALDMLSRIDDKIGIAYVFCNYGIVYRYKKEWAKSIKYFKFSLNIVKNIRTPGLEAYVLKEYADMQNDWGKKAKAKELALEARTIYSNMGAKYYVEMMNEIMARIEGTSYEMDVKMSEEAIKAVEEASEVPEPEHEQMVREPIVFEEKGGRPKAVVVKSAAAKGEMAFSDEGPKVIKAEEVRTTVVVKDRPKVKEQQKADDLTIYLFIPDEKDEDETFRRQKVRFYVELPFVAPDLDVVEIRKGENHELSSKISDYPSVLLLGKVFPGIPSAKDLSDEIKALSRGPRKKAPTRKPETLKVPTKKAPAPAKTGKAKFHYSYLMEGEDHAAAYRMVHDIMSKGAKAMVVTRPPIRKIKDEFGLDDAEFLLISTSESPRKGQHPVQDLDELGRQIEAFMETNEKSIVLLDRAELMMKHAGFDRFLRMVHILNECIDACQSILLVPMDSHLVGKMEMRTLRRELSKI